MISCPKVRDRSRSSQRPSFDLSSARSTQATSAGAGTKRLFSNRASRLSLEPELQERHDDVQRTYSGKRNRSDNWPLSDSSPVISSHPRKPLHSRDAPNSPILDRPNPVKRPSKFVEGSMNDRTSRKPEATYLGIEQDSLMENHAWEQVIKPRPQSCIPASNTSNTVLPDVSRHSSIFRFGKSIAATFNPTNWKMFSKQDRTASEVEIEDPQQKVLRERQEKAEKIYAELKQTGHFPTIRAQNLEALLDRNSRVKHDSGVALGDDRGTSSTRASIDSQRSMSREDKRKGMIFLEPPVITSNRQRGLSPSTSNFSTPSRTSFQNLKRNSTSNIKKKFNYDSNNDSKTDLGDPEGSTHKLPSRKEIQKQQKLVKRVSDLESKLEQARRKLYESPANEVPLLDHRGRPRRRKFVPGAMPTLHSERLLAAYIPPDDEDDEEDEIGKAITQNVVVEPRQSLEETRGRGRSVREPEVSPSQFYPPPSPLTRDALLSQQTPLGHRKFVNVNHVMVDGTSDTNVTTEVSIVQSEYIERVAPSENETEILSIVESTSVMTPSELDTEDDVITPKGRSGTSANATPKKLVRNEPTPKKASPTGKVITPGKITPSARKRKALVDNSGVYKPTDDSISDQSEIRPVKKVIQKRKAVARAQPTPPRRLPSIPIATLHSKNADGSKPPIRSISRKAVPRPAAQPQEVVTENKSNVRQSTPPPPSVPTFQPELDIKRSSDIQSISPNLEGTVGIEHVQTDDPAPSQEAEDLHGRRARDHSPGIPPMPKLPRSVRLPNGEVVDVKSRTPVVAPKASSRAESRTRSATGIPKSGGLNSKDQKSSTIDAENHQNHAAKSSARNSFEWPSDCF